MSLKVEDINFEEFTGVKEIYTIAHNTSNGVEYYTAEMIFSEMPRKLITTFFTYQGMPVVDKLFKYELIRAIKEYPQKKLEVS